MIDYVKLWNDLRSKITESIADCNVEVAEQVIEKEVYATIYGLMGYLEENADD